MSRETAYPAGALTGKGRDWQETGQGCSWLASIPTPPQPQASDAPSWHGHSPAARRRASASPAARRTTGQGPTQKQTKPEAERKVLISSKIPCGVALGVAVTDCSFQGGTSANLWAHRGTGVKRTGRWGKGDIPTGQPGFSWGRHPSSCHSGAAGPLCLPSDAASE